MSGPPATVPDPKAVQRANRQINAWLIVSAAALLGVFALTFSLTYLEWVPTAHSSARPLSRRFLIILVLTGLIAIPWVLIPPTQRFLRNGRSRWLVVSPTHAVRPAGEPDHRLQTMWPALRPLVSVTERLAYLDCLLICSCMLLMLMHVMQSAPFGWPLGAALVAGLGLTGFLLRRLRHQLQFWQAGYYVLHRYRIPLFSTFHF